MNAPRYSVGTWDADEQAYTPQIGVRCSLNCTLMELRQSLKELRALGYSAHRARDEHGEHYSDPVVLVERTDGKPEAEILEDWKR